MASESDETFQTLDELSTSLTSLEQALEPLMATSFEELSKSLEPLQRARLDVMTSYMVHDLIWVYLRTAGVDPSTHPVMLELQRMKDYFDKIKHAEQPPAKRGYTLDKEAAARFINAAISNGSKGKRTEGAVEVSSGPSGTHLRFENDDENTSSGESKKAVAAEKSKAAESKEGKKSRVKLDPFAGYDDASTTPKSSKKSKKKQQQQDKSEVKLSEKQRKRSVDDVVNDGEEEGSAKKKQKEASSAVEQSPAIKSEASGGKKKKKGKSKK
ncbi:hypothetical protein OIV83_000015 [Microbotryomycetes sp. JL201]|nr:hypothetical protein OIV83_000015 [Microbotryomycetes sp. JL201]